MLACGPLWNPSALLVSDEDVTGQDQQDESVCSRTNSWIYPRRWNDSPAQNSDLASFDFESWLSSPLGFPALLVKQTLPFSSNLSQTKSLTRARVTLSLLVLFPRVSLTSRKLWKMEKHMNKWLRFLAGSLSSSLCQVIYSCLNTNDISCIGNYSWLVKSSVRWHLPRVLKNWWVINNFLAVKQATFLLVYRSWNAVLFSRNFLHVRACVHWNGFLARPENDHVNFSLFYLFTHSERQPFIAVEMNCQIVVFDREIDSSCLT